VCADAEEAVGEDEEGGVIKRERENEKERKRQKNLDASRHRDIFNSCICRRSR